MVMALEYLIKIRQIPKYIYVSIHTQFIKKKKNGELVSNKFNSHSDKGAIIDYLNGAFDIWREEDSSYIQ